MSTFGDMVKAQDLRIGNLVYNETEVVRIESILGSTLHAYCHSLDREYLCDCELSDLAAIPLSEEWLLKLGYRLIDVDDTTKVYSLKNKEPFMIMVSTEKEFWMCLTSRYYIDQTFVEHVHQLQNIHFSLTGAELTLSEKATEITYNRGQELYK